MSTITKGNALWLTWETQPRNRSMARELGVPLYVFDFHGSRLKRQLRAIAATLRLLWTARPAVVFAPNPSLILTYLLLACRVVFRYRYVCDAHYGGVVDVTGSRFVQRLLNFANRHADLVIVTNDGHAERVRECGGTTFVCPDPLPQIPQSTARPAAMNGTEKSVLFICSYDADEPFNEVFAAARLLADRGFRLFASGRYARAGVTAGLHPHVELLGYVDRATYDAYLHNVDIILDLTTWQDCLVCGAYEAMAAGKPCVLSRTKALSELFTHGT
ncbi:MAG TPA: glycosyltransferase, partial [Gemmatimonadaceae bacterium]|nr:glycosyltransferase [Gemmatimonadaceae bacterium]